MDLAAAEALKGAFAVIGYGLAAIGPGISQLRIGDLERCG